MLKIILLPPEDSAAFFKHSPAFDQAEALLMELLSDFPAAETAKEVRLVASVVAAPNSCRALLVGQIGAACVGISAFTVQLHTRRRPSVRISLSTACHCCVARRVQCFRLASPVHLAESFLFSELPKTRDFYQRCGLVVRIGEKRILIEAMARIKSKYARKDEAVQIRVCVLQD